METYSSHEGCSQTELLFCFLFNEVIALLMESHSQQYLPINKESPLTSEKVKFNKNWTLFM